MSFETLADSMVKKVKNLGWVDIGLLKVSVMGFTLMIAKIWKPLLSLDWYWYAIIFVIAGIKPICKYLGK